MRRFSPEETARWAASLERRASCAVAWLETNDGRIVIVKSDYKAHWALPGGIIDAGETPRQAVRREVMEEVGITLPLDAFTFESVSHVPHADLGVFYLFIFSAHVSDAQVDGIVLQVSEIEALKLVTRDEVHSKNLPYGRSIEAWASDIRGYIEA